MTRMSMMSETLAETLYGLPGPAMRPVPRQRRLLAGFTAGAVALSVVLASAAPVRAEGNRDLVKALAAIAVIGVIVHEANKDRDRKPKPVEHRPQDWDKNWPHPNHPRPQPQRVSIPTACAIQIDGRDSPDVVVYAESCLRDYGVNARLPDYCARDIRFYGQRDRVYPELCLREAGYRFHYHHPRTEHERPD